jgi:hypothetical protein
MEEWPNETARIRHASLRCDTRRAAHVRSVALPYGPNAARWCIALRCPPFCRLPYRSQQRLDADDIHHAGEVIAEHIQRHFCGDVLQSLHQEVRRAQTGANGLVDRECSVCSSS